MARISILGGFEHLILASVARLGDAAHGSAVQKEVEQCTGRCTTISAVHTTLERLTEKHYLSLQTVDPRFRIKKLYVPTEAGRNALLDAKEAIDHIWSGLALERNQRSSLSNATSAKRAGPPRSSKQK
jgi:PadR family transcriptional regulator PadR